MGAAMADKVVAQQWQRQRSNGNGGTVTAMEVQQWLRQRSNGNGNGGVAMGVAAVVAVQKWGRSNGGGGTAMVVDRSHHRVWYHRIVLYSVFVKQIDILRSFLHRPYTYRFPDDVPKKIRRNRNRDSCEKSATGAEKTGIRMIPAGIGNLALIICRERQRWVRRTGRRRLIVVWLLDSAPSHPGTEEAAPTQLWYYMAGGGRGGPVVIPHPDNDDIGSTNANDNDDTPSPPQKNNGDIPRGEGNGTTMVPDNDAMAAAASIGTVATKAMRSVVRERAICVRWQMAWVGS